MAHYNYFRDYDPSIGRFIQSDPLGLVGGPNTYGYVGGNPIGNTDSSGQLLFIPIVIGLAASSGEAGAVAVGGAVLIGGAAWWASNKSAANQNGDGSNSDGSEAGAKIYPFPAKSEKQCPADDPDGSCQKEKNRLELVKTEIWGLLVSGQMSFSVYRSAAARVNDQIEIHNRRCPARFSVSPMPGGKGP